MENLPARLDDLITFVKNRHPEGGALEHLSDAVLVSERLGELSDHLIGHFVDQARRTGASWTDIGQSMGVSKQAVQKRFVPRAADGPEPLASGVWARFTERAQHVITQAQEEARRAGRDHVDTDHLVLGLLAEPESLAVRAIQAQGVSPDEVRAAVAAAAGPPGEEVPPGHIPFTAQAKKVRDLTVREALRLGHNYIGTEHILLGLLSDDQGAGHRILDGLGVTKETTERWILSALDELLQARRDGA
ncbi:Clp protease N-terminal domain-containing protein [Actinomadura scrupuli]|uniref:Clp protease N-terminal domain-containing protein n=1 Tax=Actinomadura scrupuli TaxID=559629 RepID=UPI003D954A38